MAFEQLYKEFFQQADKETLQRMTKDYPYFSPAHFFVLQQSTPGDNDHPSFAAKAALHFADPLLLHFQLNNREQKKEERSPAEPEPEPQVVEEHVYETSAAQPIDNPFFDTPETNESIGEEKTITAQGVNEPLPEEPMEKMKEELLFEPLYTTDYFASQGIKLSEVVQSGDKMGRQLKSFTEWLKTMKKVHPEGLNDKNTPGTAIDNAVQHMADRSNEEEEVLTESMAAVYIQQGKLNKARDIYKKLSLLNPSKSAYFAAKLNEIQ